MQSVLVLFNAVPLSLTLLKRTYHTNRDLANLGGIKGVKCYKLLANATFFRGRLHIFLTGATRRNLVGNGQNNEHYFWGG